MYEIMLDDRLARRYDELWELLQEELLYIAGISSRTWMRLAATACQGSTSAPELYSMTLRAAYLSGAYADRKFFRVLRSLPWSLVCGPGISIEQKLREFMQQPCPLDEVAARIWQLLHDGGTGPRVAGGGAQVSFGVRTPHANSQGIPPHGPSVFF